MKRILLVLLIALPLFAQERPAPTPPPGDPGGGRRGGMMRMPGPGFGGKWWNNSELAAKLNLTDQQKTQMEQIFQQSRLKLIDQRAAVEKAEATLEPLMSSDRPDEAQVLAQIDKVAQARAELEKTNARMQLGIRQVLTADQWKQLKEQTPRAAMRMREGGGPDRPRARQFGRPGEGQPAPAAPPPPEEE
jgi:protein CpxP